MSAIKEFQLLARFGTLDSTTLKANQATVEQIGEHFIKGAKNLTSLDYIKKLDEQHLIKLCKAVYSELLSPEARKACNQILEYLNEKPIDTVVVHKRLLKESDFNVLLATASRDQHLERESHKGIKLLRDLQQELPKIIDRETSKHSSSTAWEKVNQYIHEKLKEVVVAEGLTIPVGDKGEQLLHHFQDAFFANAGFAQHKSPKLSSDDKVAYAQLAFAAGPKAGVEGIHVLEKMAGAHEAAETTEGASKAAEGGHESTAETAHHESSGLIDEHTMHALEIAAGATMLAVGAGLVGLGGYQFVQASKKLKKLDHLKEQTLDAKKAHQASDDFFTKYSEVLVKSTGNPQWGDRTSSLWIDFERNVKTDPAIAHRVLELIEARVGQEEHHTEHVKSHAKSTIVKGALMATAGGLALAGVAAGATVAAAGAGLLLAGTSAKDAAAARAAVKNADVRALALTTVKAELASAAIAPQEKSDLQTLADMRARSIKQHRSKQNLSFMSKSCLALGGLFGATSATMATVGTIAGTALVVAGVSAVAATGIGAAVLLGGALICGGFYLAKRALDKRRQQKNQTAEQNALNRIHDRVSHAPQSVTAKYVHKILAAGQPDAHATENAYALDFMLHSNRALESHEALSGGHHGHGAIAHGHAAAAHATTTHASHAAHASHAPAATQHHHVDAHATTSSTSGSTSQEILTERLMAATKLEQQRKAEELTKELELLQRKAQGHET